MIGAAPGNPVEGYAASSISSTYASLSFAFSVGGPLRGNHPGVLRITSPSVDPGSPPSNAQAIVLRGCKPLPSGIIKKRPSGQPRLLSIWWRRGVLPPSPARLRSTSPNSTCTVLAFLLDFNSYFGAPGRIRTRNSGLRRASPVRLAGAYWSGERDSNPHCTD